MNEVLGEGSSLLVNKDEMQNVFKDAEITYSKKLQELDDDNILSIMCNGRTFEKRAGDLRIMLI